MRTSIRLLLLGGIAMLSAVKPAAAATYESYHCHCTAAKDETCSCSYDFTLSQSQTKEFRGYCDEMPPDAIYPKVGVNGRDGGTSCTVQFGSYTDNYTSKSCTNWDPFSKDNITIKVTCTNFVPPNAGD